MFYLALRHHRVVLGAAVVLSILSTVDTTFAQTNLESQVSIPNLEIAALPALDTPDAPPVTIDFNGVSSVDASSISLVALAARQVSLAKTAPGAKSVAKTIIETDYSSWNNSQVSCLNQLWDSESHWNFQAHNYRSGAHGIPQALPATKMEVVGTDWRTNPVTQIKWGLSYIKARYGTPCKALANKHRKGYY